MLNSVIFLWISLSGLFFCYLGYGLLLFIFNRFKKIAGIGKKKETAIDWLPVSIIITAYNEGTVLEKKIKNTMDLDYPPGKLKIIFVTDGSTDGSENIIKEFPGLLLLHSAERKGKMSAIKRAMQHADTPVVIFSDANSELNIDCIYRMVSHYADPATGGVAGEKKIIKDQRTSAVGEAEDQ